MSYDPYKVYDIHRYRHPEHGGPRIHPRCAAMSHGDRCEYREHAGKRHAALSGSHLWVEEPLGVCSVCGANQYPLGVLWQPEGAGHWLRTTCCDDGVVQANLVLVHDADDEYLSRAEWREDAHHAARTSDPIDPYRRLAEAIVNGTMPEDAS